MSGPEEIDDEYEKLLAETEAAYDEMAAEIDAAYAALLQLETEEEAES